MSSLPALDIFLNDYQQAYLDKLGEHPRYYAQQQPSECILGDLDVETEDALQWKSVLREEPGVFENVEHALELSLHADLSAFYGTYFSAPLMFDSAWGTGELLQAWSQTDFEYLQQNIIGHLMMKKKLKQDPTWFIGVFDDEDKMITVNNTDGSVWIEIPGEIQSEKLADSLNGFIAELRARVTPPVKLVEEDMPILDHPGIWQRMKMMWRNLLGK
ncbi:SecY-interacting protein [Shewanella sp. KX20019]|uniref:SecY-interacting protein n=1 Tax=Shewanella sp. KX20019 TaxID=2803864 RepID=UPI001926B1A5|nr:SecY-interacting protein [Shewanella sp. KX20019]QQX79057.1 SecY-interacting protein [Shewanella sp. KX20019]